MNNQDITGSNNIQAGRDIHINIARPEIPSDNPNFEDCPSCWQPVSVLAITCPHSNCGADIQGYKEKTKARNEQLTVNYKYKKRMFYVLCAFMVVFLFIEPWYVAFLAVFNVFVYRDMNNAYIELMSKYEDY